MITINDEINYAYPGTKIGILIMKNIFYLDCLNQRDMSISLNKIHRRYGHSDRKELKNLNPIHAYTSYYKKFGYTYPVLAQLESVLKGKKALHAQPGLLQAMFLSELESMLLTAGHDLTKLKLPLQLKLASGNETYKSISVKEVTAVRGDLMICDNKNIISSILRGPDFESCILESTADVLFTIYGPPGIETDYIESSLQRLEEMIKAFSHSSSTEIIQVF